jgi:hypothetical protein
MVTFNKLIKIDAILHDKYVVLSRLVFDSYHIDKNRLTDFPSQCTTLVNARLIGKSATPTLCIKLEITPRILGRLGSN